MNTAINSKFLLKFYLLNYVFKYNMCNFVNLVYILKGDQIFSYQQKYMNKKFLTNTSLENQLAPIQHFCFYAPLVLQQQYDNNATV